MKSVDLLCAASGVLPAAGCKFLAAHNTMPPTVQANQHVAVWESAAADELQPCFPNCFTLPDNQGANSPFLSSEYCFKKRWLAPLCFCLPDSHGCSCCLPSAPPLLLPPACLKLGEAEGAAECCCLLDWRDSSPGLLAKLLLAGTPYGTCRTHAKPGCQESLLTRHAQSAIGSRPLAAPVSAGHAWQGMQDICQLLPDAAAA